MNTQANNMTDSKLTAAELMTWHEETLAEQRLERTLRNIQARAAVLLTTAGYSLNADGKAHDCMNFVFGPQGQVYTVNLTGDKAHFCDCPAYADYGTCKHYLAVKRVAEEQAEEAALCGAHDAEEADADWYTDRVTFRSHEVSSHFAEAA